MTTCGTCGTDCGDLVTKEILRAGKNNYDAWIEFINSNTDTMLTPNGVTTPTLRGHLKKLGYQAPVAYAAGLSITTGLETVDFNGTIYAANPSALPINSTPATFDPTDWYPIQLRTTGVYHPANYGAAGDGVADDTSAVQEAIFAAHVAGGGTVVLEQHRITDHLYVPGAVNLVGKSSDSLLMLDSNALTHEFWIVAGVTKSAANAGNAHNWTAPVSGNVYNLPDEVSQWTGRADDFRIETTANSPAPNLRAFTIPNGRNCTVRDVVFDFRNAAAGAQQGCISTPVNALLIASGASERTNITYESCTAYADQYADGKESFSMTLATGCKFLRLQTYGPWGDDAIGMHNIDDVIVDGCQFETGNGRILIASSKNVKITNTTMRRVTLGDGSIPNGGAFIQCNIRDTAANNDRVSQDIVINNVTIYHHPQTSSATHGIRMRGGKRVTITNCQVFDTTGFGFGVVVTSDNSVTGWSDPEGIEPDSTSRPRNYTVSNNQYFSQETLQPIQTSIALQGPGSDNVGPILRYGNMPKMTGNTDNEHEFGINGHGLTIAGAAPQTLRLDGIQVDT